MTNDPADDLGLVLREAGPDDAQAIRALTRRAYAEWVPVMGREPKPMGADYDHAVRHHRILLAFSGEALAGLIELVSEPDVLLIENLAVSIDHRRRGIGRLLVARAQAIAAAEGRARLRLYTNRLMQTNIARYGRLGFTIDREEANAFGTVVHMSRPVGAH